eukprot:1440021-Rhodomonas_salina.2
MLSEQQRQQLALQQQQQVSRPVPAVPRIRVRLVPAVPRIRVRLVPTAPQIRVLRELRYKGSPVLRRTVWECAGTVQSACARGGADGGNLLSLLFS